MSSETASRPIRLAIIEADTPVPKVAAKYGSYGKVFTYLFKRACESLVPPQSLESQLDIKAYNVVDQDLLVYPELQDVDAVLITGSKHNAFENRPWITGLVAFARKCLDNKVPIVGICFGHQIVARALGAEVGRNNGEWELSVTPCELTEEGKKVLGLEKLSIQQMHQDIVYSMPEGVIQLARTEVCANQGMYQPGCMITVQGHPEFTEDMMREILQVRFDSKIIDQEKYDGGMSRAGKHHDGVAIAQRFLRFFREG